MDGSRDVDYEGSVKRNFSEKGVLLVAHFGDAKCGSGRRIQVPVRSQTGGAPPHGVRSMRDLGEFSPSAAEMRAARAAAGVRAHLC